MNDKSAVENIQASWAAAAQALEVMLGQLHKAGFAEAQDKYEQMARTIVLQAGWLDGNALDVHLREKDRIRRAAAEIAGILGPYLRLMRSLVALGGRASALERESREVEERGEAVLHSSGASLISELPRRADDQDVDDAVLGLLREGKPMSLTQISAACGAPTRKVKVALDEMASAGKVLCTKGSRPRFALRLGAQE